MSSAIKALRRFRRARRQFLPGASCRSTAS